MKIKIDIFSGFLGAGKTFLIKKLISEEVYNNEIAIIENEFGEVSIDAFILKDSNIKIKEINSGCICCEVTGDFKEAVLEVIKKYNPSRIIIEPSGVAKLTDIINIFKENKLKDVVEIENIITVIDPEKFNMYSSNFKEFYKNQIVNAKKIILSRTQNLSQEKINEVVSKIKKLNRKSEILSEDWDKIYWKDVLKVNKEASLNISEYKGSIPKLRSEEIAKAKDVFDSIAIYPNKEFDKNELASKFRFISSSKAYGDIIRAKGVVKLRSSKYGQFDFVKDEFNIRSVNNSNCSIISFIGVKLNKKAIENLFL